MPTPEQEDEGVAGIAAVANQHNNSSSNCKKYDSLTIYLLHDDSTRVVVL